LNPRIIDVTRSADLIIRRLLAVKPGEQVALVCDPHTEMAMAYALAGATESVGAEYTIMMMPTRTTERKNDLTPVIEKGLEAADCLIGLTGSCGAPTYATAVKRLYNEKRLRAISMVMRTLDNFTEGGARADYDALYAEGQQLAAIWREAAHIQLTTPAGTDLHAPIAGETVIIECGFALEPGLEAAFSDGEVSQMPRQGRAEGILVVDGPIAHLGRLDSPITMQVSHGRVTEVQGDCRQADELRHIIETIPNAANIAEIGIGLNAACRRNGDFEEEKKGRGNVHVALGDNVFYGGDVHSPVHMDMVLYRPTVRLDERVVVEKGVVIGDLIEVFPISGDTTNE
jgi:leucyl aminopeptidase (aminopeptidase T)